MYMPIWILYWFQILFPMNYALKLGVITLVLTIVAKRAGDSTVSSTKATLKSLCFSVAAEIAGLSVFWIAEMKMNLSFEVYYSHYTTVSVLALCAAVILNFLLNRVLNFRDVDLPDTWKTLVPVGISLLTAPVLFLLPSGIYV